MMQERLPTNGDAALWLWARIRRDDLVLQCRRARGQVLLTYRIPRERVLLSGVTSQDDHVHLDTVFGPVNLNLPTRIDVAVDPGARDDRRPRTVDPGCAREGGRIRLPREGTA